MLLWDTSEARSHRQKLQRTERLSVVVHAHNVGAHKAEAEGSRVWEQLVRYQVLFGLEMDLGCRVLA